MKKKDYRTISEAAELMSINPQAVKWWVDRKFLQSTKMDGRYYVDMEEARAVHKEILKDRKTLNENYAYYKTQSPKYTLTLEDLEMFEKNAVMFSSFGFIPHPCPLQATPVAMGGSLARDGFSAYVRFVLTTGTIGDWSIYHSLSSSFITQDYFDSNAHLYVLEDRIYRLGTKLSNEMVIRKLITCSDAVFEKYRF